MAGNIEVWRVLRFENDEGKYAEVGTFLGPDLVPVPPGYRLVSSTRMVPADTREPRYDREVLVDVLAHHQRTDTSGCHCGWNRLEASHSEHVADIYEQAIADA